MKCKYCHGELKYSQTAGTNDFGDKFYRLDIVCKGTCQNVWRDIDLLEDSNG